MGSRAPPAGPVVFLPAGSLRRLALAIIGLDVATLGDQLRAARQSALTQAA